MRYIPIGEFGTVEDLEGNSKLGFFSDSQDVASLKGYLGEASEEFDAFYMEYGDGDWSAAYGMNGRVPWLTTRVYRLK
jgi:hypothetical protein